MVDNAKNIISGTGFIDWLIEQGVIDDGPITRVIVDAPFDGAVQIRVVQHGNTGLIDEDAPESFAALRDMVETVELAAME